MTQNTKLIPTHPGEILTEEFVKPLGLTLEVLSQECGIPVDTLAALADGSTSFTPELSSKMAAYFGTFEGFWYFLQRTYNTRAIKDPTSNKDTH